VAAGVELDLAVGGRVDALAVDPDLDLGRPVDGELQGRDLGRDRDRMVLRRILVLGQLFSAAAACALRTT